MQALRPHALDRVVGLLTQRVRLFSQGWGEEDVIAQFETPPFVAVPAPAQPRWGPIHRGARRVRCDGTFVSPIERLPPEVRTARVRWIRADRPTHTAILVLTSAGDEGFWLRSRLFGPLADEGIDVFLLENPFYGGRRPNGQRGGRIRTVADHALMNFATIEEARALLAWLRGNGWNRLGLVGYSMGGFMAAAAASLTTEPLAVSVLAAGASSAKALTRGFISRSIDFTALGGSLDQAEAARERLALLFEKADLAHFPPIPRPAAAILVACERDGFVPAEVVEALHAHWPGSELRRIDAGHISAVFTHRKQLRAAVRDALDRLPASPTLHATLHATLQ